MIGQSSNLGDSKVMVCIMRHGMAEPIAEHDTQRRLVDFGVEQVHDTSRWFTTQFPNTTFDLAIVSPYVRAQQTLDIVCQHVSVSNKMICSEIEPDAEPTVMHDCLLGLLGTSDTAKEVKSILLVSHMPFISLFLAQIAYNSNAILFNTGAMAVIECNRQTLIGTLKQQYQSIL